MIALIDGDLCVYRVGFTTQNDPEWVAKARVDDLLEGIIRDLDVSQYRIFLTKNNDPDAFRQKQYPEYKANRKSPKPVHYEYLRKYLEEGWDAQIVSVIEADDALAIASGPGTIICSIDKDLLQIPGQHYNFVKKEICQITESEGLHRFYEQLLKGDPADNIKGIPGIGEVRAKKLLAGLETEQAMFDKVLEQYGIEEEMLMNGLCLWLRRTSDDDYRRRFEQLLQTSSRSNSENISY